MKYTRPKRKNSYYDTTMKTQSQIPSIPYPTVPFLFCPSLPTYQIRPSFTKHKTSKKNKNENRNKNRDKINSRVYGYHVLEMPAEPPPRIHTPSSQP